MNYSIGEFSKLCGLSIDTLRYYEKEELIFSHRTENNRRIYSDKDIVWIQFILRLKQTGMSIRDMKLYTKLRYDGDDTIPQRLDLLFKQLENLHKQQAIIDHHISFIEEKMKTYFGIMSEEIISK